MDRRRLRRGELQLCHLCQETSSSSGRMRRKREEKNRRDRTRENRDSNCETERQSFAQTWRKRDLLTILKEIKRLDLLGHNVLTVRFALVIVILSLATANPAAESQLRKYCLEVRDGAYCFFYKQVTMLFPPNMQKCHKLNVKILNVGLV